MKPFFLFFSFSLFVISGFGQDFKSEFFKHCETPDTLKQLEVLKAWEKATPEDAELFVAYFNYHFLKSQKELISFTTDEPDGEALLLQDSAKQATAYLSSEVYYLEDEFQKGIDKINEGIKLYPNRLDMRFGKIYTYSKREHWENFTTSIIETINYSKQNNNQWTWAEGKVYEGGEERFLQDLQAYQLTLYNQQDDALLVNMRRIAEVILKHYPEHVPSLSNISVTYLLVGEFEKALEPLLVAEKLDTKDAIVLSNIAHAYKLLGDTKKSIEYYEKTIKYGDESMVSFAKEMIEELSQ